MDDYDFENENDVTEFCPNALPSSPQNVENQMENNPGSPIQ